jgi:hypothetical protein
MSKSGMEGGIEEAFEEQREAQRIDIRDRQRIGDQRAGTRTTARPDGNAVRFRPFDEVGNDEEVARKLHVLDDVELDLQPIMIIGLAVASADPELGDPLGEPKLRLSPQFRALGQIVGLGIVGCTGKARQNRLDGAEQEGAPDRDLDRVVQRFRQVGEKRRHLGLALETMILR